MPAEIGTYPNKSAPGAADKVLGTDSVDGSTKNFRFTDMPFNFYDIGGGFIDAPTASDYVLFVVTPRAFSLPTTGHQAVCETLATAAPGSDATFTIYRRAAGTTTDTAIGTIKWNSGSHLGTVTITSVTAFAVGDVIKVVAPASPDATLAKATITLTASLLF